MARRKDVRRRGKIPFSRAFQEINEGDYVAIVRESAMQPSFPKSLQGRSGVVEKKRGKAFLVKVKDSNKEKKFLIEPVHLKKLQTQ